MFRLLMICCALLMFVVPSPVMADYTMEEANSYLTDLNMEVTSSVSALGTLADSMSDYMDMRDTTE